MIYKCPPILKYLLLVIMMYAFLYPYQSITREDYLLIALIFGIFYLVIDYMFICDHTHFFETKQRKHNDKLLDIIADDNNDTDTISTDTNSTESKHSAKSMKSNKSYNSAISTRTRYSVDPRNIQYPPDQQIDPNPIYTKYHDDQVNNEYSAYNM